MTLSGETSALIVGGIVFVFTVMAIVLAVASASARSLIVPVAGGMVIAASAAPALLAVHPNVLPAIAVACIGCALFPVTLVGSISLSTSAARKQTRAPWLSALLACVTIGLVIFVLPELNEAPAPLRGETVTGLPALLALIVFVAVICTAGLVGFGDRGVLGARAAGRSR